MDGHTKIAVVDNLFEAQIIGAILEERQIPYLLKSYYDSAYNGIFQGQKGWGAVYASQEHASEIIEIITAIRMKATETDDGE